MSRMLRLLFCCAAAWGLLPAGVRAQAAKVPEPTLRAVSDFAGLLDAAAQARIEEKLRAFRDSSGNQIVFISVPVAWRGDESIEGYSLKIAEKWQIGRKKADNGVVFLIVGTPQDTAGRGVRFEVGYGLEGTLPDAICKRIQMETVVPRLQAGDYPGAVEQGADALITVLGGGTLPQPRHSQYHQEMPWIEILFLIAIFSMIIFSFFRGGIRHTGGGTGWTSSGFWGGGGGGGFSGGGGSFGGGGGSFGGGGASSSW